MNANLKTLKVAGKCQNTKWQENVKTLKVAGKRSFMMQYL